MNSRTALTLNGRSSARLNGVSVEIRSDGWRYRYTDGWIREAIAPSGVALSWLYKGDRIANIQGPGGQSLLAVHVSNEGIVLEGVSGTFRFRREGPDSAGTTRWFFFFPDGREMKMVFSSEGGGVTRLKVISPGMEDCLYRWRSDSGALLSDGDFTYEVRPTDTGMPLLHRIAQQGWTEWYMFDTVRGMSIYKRQDGSRVVSWYHVQPGPTYMKAFRMDSLSEDQRLVSSRRVAYDAGGNVLKEWTEPGEASLGGSQGVRYIGLEEAERLHGQPDVLFVDARTAAEYSRGHIPGSVRLGRSQFVADFASLKRDLRAVRMLVVYCTSRQCEDSSIVATQLWQRGFRNILLFEGGWAEWGKENQ